MEKKYEVTVVICTRNRAKLLVNCINSLVQQSPVNISDYEVIVVDNASTDNTKQVVFMEQFRTLNMNYLYEPRLGLSFSRNAGINSAKGDIICFIDDDVVVEKHYIYEIITSFQNPKVSCVGGKAVPSWENSKPPFWFSPKFGHVVGQTFFGDKSRFMEKDEFPFGCNMAFRKATLNQTDGFNENLGKKSNNYIYGEDIDLCYKLQKKGTVFFYSSRAVVFHHVGQERATKKYFLNSVFGKGVTEGYQKRHNKGFTIACIYLAAKLLMLCLLYVGMVLPAVPIKKRFEYKCAIYCTLGYICYFLFPRKINF